MVLGLLANGLGLLANGLGLLAMGGVRFASSFFSFSGDGVFDECGCGWVCD